MDLNSTPSVEDALRARIAELEKERRSLSPTTITGLLLAIDKQLPTNLRGIDIIVDYDDEGDITLIFTGLTTTSDGSLSLREIEFEVEGTITLPISFVVTATSETEAEDVGDEVLRDLIESIDTPRVYRDEVRDGVEIDPWSADSEVTSIRET